MVDTHELFWNGSVDDIMRGYVHKEERYICLVCGAVYEEGMIYPQGKNLYQAKKAVESHILEEHGSMFDYLLEMNRRYTGLTELQQELLAYFNQGLSDKEIVKRQGGGSPSTIRNHRFKLREKEKQAKVFLAIMGLLGQEDKAQERKDHEWVNIHKGATMVDERYAITEKEGEKVLNTYFKEGKEGRLSSFPSKEKRKIIVLQQLIKDFEPNRRYTEKEVNRLLKRRYNDFVTIRRYFIEYGFMDRTRDCSAYWIKH